MLGDEIHKSTDKQEREKATQKQVGEHNVFSPMTAKKKFNFFFNIIQQQNHSYISQLFRNLDKSLKILPSSSRLTALAIIWHFDHKYILFTFP